MSPRRSPDSSTITRNPVRRRLFVVLVVIALLFSVVAGRMTQLQVVSASSLSDMGEDQRIRTVQLAADRGSIFDRNGYELALSVPQKTIWADPKSIDDPYRSAALLAPALGRDVYEIDKLLRTNGRFVYLARKVSDDVAQRVEALDLPGVETYEEPKRFLPDDQLLAPVLGRVGMDNEGLSGLEAQYKAQLEGEKGSMMVEQDPAGRDIPGGFRNVVEPVRGNDLVLTIDRDLQHKVESALADEIEVANARGGMAAMMDTKTGEIMALANLSVPDGKRGTPVEAASSNLALTNVYEPGSVQKLITVSGALEENLIDPNTSMVVGNTIKVADTVFKEHEDHPVIPYNVTQLVANSSNVGTIMIGQKLGKERLDRYMRDFGFGTGTGLGFPGESAGLMLDTDDYSGTSLPTISIGQGLAVTAMQMLAATNVIANNGTYVAPKLVKATIDKDGARRDSDPSPTHEVVSSETASEMSAMLKEVVRVGTATAAQIDGYEVAGKTGTARKPNVDRAGYELGAYVSSFAGFVPVGDPQLTGIVILDQPQPIYGGLVAAPVFADIARYGLQRLDIAPAPSDPDNFGVPAVDPRSAASVGEADAPAGTTAEEAEAVKESTNRASTSTTVPVRRERESG